MELDHLKLLNLLLMICHSADKQMNNLAHVYKIVVLSPSIVKLK